MVQKCPKAKVACRFQSTMMQTYPHEYLGLLWVIYPVNNLPPAYAHEGSTHPLWPPIVSHSDRVVTTRFLGAGTYQILSDTYPFSKLRLPKVQTLSKKAECKCTPHQHVTPTSSWSSSLLTTTQRNENSLSSMLEVVFRDTNG